MLPKVKYYTFLLRDAMAKIVKDDEELSSLVDEIYDPKIVVRKDGTHAFIFYTCAAITCSPEGKINFKITTLRPKPRSVYSKKFDTPKDIILIGALGSFLKKLKDHVAQSKNK